MPAPYTSTAFAFIFTKMNASLNTYDGVVIERVLGMVVPASAKMLVIYAAIFGYCLMFGKIQEPARDGMFRIVRLGIIIGLLNSGRYGAYVADFFLTIPNQIAAVISGAPPGQSNINFLDSLWSQIYILGDALWQKGSILSGPGLGLMAIGGLLWIVGLLVCGAGAALLVLANFGVHVWISIGPIFILLAMFEATKQFCNSWLGQTITFGLVTVLTATVITLMMTICATYLGEAKAVGAMANPGIDQVIPVFILCGFSAVFLWQVPSLASGLGGGVAISTLGAITAAYRATRGGAGSTMNLLTGKTLSDARQERKQRVTNRNWAKNHPGKTAQALGMPMAAFRKMTSPGKNSVSKS